MFIKLSNPRITKSQHSCYFIVYKLQSPYFIESLILQFSTPEIHTTITQASVKINNNLHQSRLQSKQTEKSIRWDNLFSLVRQIIIYIKMDSKIQTQSGINGQSLIQIGISNSLIEGWDINELDYQNVYKNHHQIFTISNKLKKQNKHTQQYHLLILLANTSSRMGRKQQAYDIYSMLRKRCRQSLLLRLILWFNQLYILYTLCQEKQSNKFKNQINKMMTQSAICDYSSFITQALEQIPQISQQYKLYLQGYLCGFGLFINSTQVYGQWLPQITEKLLSTTILSLFQNHFFVNHLQFLLMIYWSVNDDELLVSEYYCKLLVNCIFKVMLVEICSQKDMNELQQNILVIFLLKLSEKLISKGIQFELSLQIWFNLLQITLNNEQLRLIPSLIVEKIQCFSLSEIEFQAIFSKSFDNYEILFLTSRLIFKTCLENLTTNEIKIVKNSLLPYSLLNQQNMNQMIEWVKITKQNNQSIDSDQIVYEFLTSQKFDQISDECFEEMLQNQHFIHYLKEYFKNKVYEESYLNLFNRTYQKFKYDCKGLQVLLLLGENVNSILKIQILKSIIYQPIDFTFTNHLFIFIRSFLLQENKRQFFIELIEKNLNSIIKNRKEFSQIEEFKRQILGEKIYKILVFIYLQTQKQDNYLQGIKFQVKSQHIYAIRESGKLSLWNKYYQKLYIVLSFLEPINFYQQIKIIKDMDSLHLLLLICHQKDSIKSISENNDLMISIKNFMDHSNSKIQTLAILLFLYFLRPSSKYFQSALIEMSRQRIKKKYLKIRFSQETGSKDRRNSDVMNEDANGLKAIQIHIQENVSSYFTRQLQKPKTQIIANYFKPRIPQQIQDNNNKTYQNENTNEENQIQFIQRIPLSQELDQLPVIEEQNKKRTPIQNLSEFQLFSIEETHEKIEKIRKKSTHQSLKKGKKKFKDNKQLAVKLSTFKGKNNKNRDYYIGMKDLKKQWFKTMNSFHQKI